MMRYYECPTRYDGGDPSLFLGGGITGCGNWQQDMRALLSDTEWVLLNPRRESFDVNDSSLDLVQIPWEHEHLRKAWALLFWFPAESICPITLYELGTFTPTNKPIFLGIHPDYKRRRDVELQTRMVRPWLKVHYSIEELAKAVRESGMDKQAPAYIP
jgi:hypothetical protein